MFFLSNFKTDFLRNQKKHKKRRSLLLAYYPLSDTVWMSASTRRLVIQVSGHLKFCVQGHTHANLLKNFLKPFFLNARIFTLWLLFSML